MLKITTNVLKWLKLLTFLKIIEITKKTAEITWKVTKTNQNVI